MNLIACSCSCYSNRITNKFVVLIPFSLYHIGPIFIGRKRGFCMDSNAELIIQKDSYKTVLYHFYSDAEPKASIIILHGMAEHHKRYYTFAKFLNSNGFDVYLYDHRGHGTDKIMKELGFFSN